jgi:hypothetical protein
MGISLHRGSTGKPGRGLVYQGLFKRRVRFLFIRRIFIEEFGRHVREDSGNGQLSPNRLPMGNLEGVGLPGILREIWRAQDMEHL